MIRFEFLRFLCCNVGMGLQKNGSCSLLSKLVSGSPFSPVLLGLHEAETSLNIKALLWAAEVQGLELKSL